MKVAEAKARLSEVRETLCRDIPQEHQSRFMDRIEWAVVNYLEETHPSKISREIKELEMAIRKTPDKTADMIGALSSGTYEYLLEYVNMSHLGELRNRETEELTVELLLPIIMASERIRAEGNRRRRIRKTIGSLPGGRPSTGLEAYLVSGLASAFAAATNKPVSSGNTTFPSRFECLVDDVLVALQIDDPKDGGFSAMDLVKRHVASRKEAISSDGPA